LKQEIGIAEKSQETRRDHWGGNVNTNPYFDSVKMLMDYQVKISICGLNYHPSDPFCLLAFFSDPYFLFENSIFLLF